MSKLGLSLNFYKLFAEYAKTAGDSKKLFSGSKGKVYSLNVYYFMLALIKTEI